MQVFYGFDAVPDSFYGSAVSIGKFDGIHHGHTQVLRRLKNLADTLHKPCVVLTFDPPPISVLHPDWNVRPICTLQRKMELLQNFSIDALFVLKTDAEFLEQSAETFFCQILQEKLHTQVIVEGSDFSFGHNRGGDADFLRRFGRQTGIEIEILTPVYSEGVAVSSSMIRQLLQKGNVEQANGLMTQPYQLTGTVVTGHRRGRTLGFPTANLEEIETVIPQDGVYASAVNVNGQQYRATTHIGTNVTFAQTQPTVESYIHGFDGDLYGKVLDIVLLAHLRGSKRFDSVDELVAQMRQDINLSENVVIPVR